MTPVALLLTALFLGMLVVIGGILVLKLEPFLALILGALVVGGLTPRTAVERHLLEKEQLRLVSVGADTEVDTDAEAAPTTVTVRAPAALGLRPGSPLLVMRAADHYAAFEEVAALQVESLADGLAVCRPTANTLPQFDDFTFDDNTIVVTPAAMMQARKQATMSVPDRIARGFGNTCASIGILIAMASIIGKCLLDSGAADRVVRSALRVCGERGAPLAFLGSGFTLAIPVFFDTVFYLMVPLAKALRIRTGRSYLLYVMAIFAGGTMAHSLVPPTPGPLFVAEALQVDLGVMMLAGVVVGLFTSLAGYFCAVWISRRMDVPLRESADFSLAEVTKSMERPDAELPPLWLSLTPILLPVVLIGGNAVLRGFADSLPTLLLTWWNILGDKNLALMIAAAISLLMLAWQKRTSLAALRPAVQAALASAGGIILITSAGGAFGGLLQETGVATLVRSLPAASAPVVITLAFCISAAIRTAQGSATVAMITSVGVLSGLATSGGLTCHPVYLALAIGCGSKPFAWLNDSGFWVICKMSGLTESEALRTVTPISGIMGITGLIVILIGSSLFPLV